MKFLIPAVIGGIIGYFTNWLAIRMLFRPYEAKYIFGFKLPFTPGLIPKEQERIAKSVGYTIEEYLLSPEVIMKHLEESDFDQVVKREIDKRLDDFEEYNIKLIDILEKYKIKPYSLGTRIERSLIEYSKSEDFRVKLSKFMDKNLSPSLEEIDSFILGKLHSEELSELVLKSGLDKLAHMDGDLKLSDLVGRDAIEKFTQFLGENERIIGYRIREVLIKGENKVRIQNIILGLVNDNMSGIIATFVSPRTIADKIYSSFEEYIKTDKAYGDINGILNILKDRLLDLKIERVREIIKDNQSLVELAENMVIKLLNTIELEDIRSIREAILKENDQLIEDFIIDNSKLIIGRILLKLKESLDNLSLVEILKILGISRSDLYKFAQSSLKLNLKDRLPSIIKSLKVGEIVEKTIYEFEFDFIEKLILDIAQKELKAITNLGGFLGAFLGLLSPLIQMITN